MNRDSLAPLDEVVGGLGRPVRHVGLVLCGDVSTPLGDGAAELADLGRTRLVLDIGAEAGHELEGQNRGDGVAQSSTTNSQ